MLTVCENDVEKPDALLTVSEVAAIFGRSESWVRGKVAIGTIARATDGREILISRDTVRSVLTARRIRGLEQPRRYLRLVVDNS
jgi:hypothetical protein